MNELLNNWESTKSYATQENLLKALAKARLDGLNGTVVVRTPEGRWTAIFIKSFLESAGLNFMAPAWAGFKVVG